MATSNGSASVQGASETYVYEYSRGLGGVDVPRDVLFTRIIYAALVIAAFCILCTRVGQLAHAQLRLFMALGAGRREQNFWSVETYPLWAFVKKQVLYAPVGSKRHNREIQLSTVVNVGTLPSRFQLVVMSLYCISQVAFCVCLDYGVNGKAALLAELRGRSGTLALFNMVPLFIFSARNNPLIYLMGISFDTFNLLHRWLGRIVMVEVVVHTVAWAINAVDAQNAQLAMASLRDSPFLWWGLIGTAASVFLALHSPSPIRHAFYETFLHLHLIGAILALIGTYYHLKIDGLPQMPWFNAIVIIWVIERVLRLVRIFYFNVGKHATKLQVKALPGEACRVDFHLPRRLNVAPGAHVYAYIPRVSWWLSHPFSVAWTADSPRVAAAASRKSEPVMDLEKKQFNDYLEGKADHQKGTTTVSVIVRAREGSTRHLYKMAMASEQKRFWATGFIEGPYQSSHPNNLASYGTAVLFSSGPGITHHLLHMRELLTLGSTECAATRQVHLIWSVQSSDHLTWVKDFMNQILELPGRREMLKVRLFVTKPMSNRLFSSPSSTVRISPGRCQPGILLDEILRNRVGATAVSVCGSGNFADEVRSATRQRIGRRMAIDFVEEAFTW